MGEAKVWRVEDDRGASLRVTARSWLEAVAVYAEQAGIPVPTPTPDNPVQLQASHGGALEIVVTWDRRVLAVQAVGERPATPLAADDVLEVLDLELRKASTRRAASEAALEAARALVSAESGAVLLLEGPHLRFMAATGPRGAGLRGVRIPSGSGLAGHALQRQRSVVVGDADEHSRHFDQLDQLTGYDTRRVLAVPIAAGGVSIGVLELMNPSDATPFDNDTLVAIGPVVRRLEAWLDRN